ncbi:MAG: M28 family peptidase [Thermoguttaceae bacterium]
MRLFHSFRSRRAVHAAAVALLGVATIAAWMLFGGHGSSSYAAGSSVASTDGSFDGPKAFEHLEQLCAIGPRPSGSPGMAKQQQLLITHFRKLGAQIAYQKFRVRHPVDGSWVPMTNILVRWRPQSPTRVLLCAHYDTLPFPMEDRENPRGVFVGANDNASGVAVLMELGRHLAAQKSGVGVDFVFLDGEEFRFRDGDRFFLGSEYFARAYLKNKPQPPYRWGVLLDMVGDKDLQLYQERNSLWWPDTRPLVADLWAIAARLGVDAFIAKPKHEVDDDHVVLHNIGKIPCIDVIDFDYPEWHTQRDVPSQCSAESLGKVGRVILEWLKTVQ